MRQYELHSIQVKLLRKIKDDMNSTKMFDEFLGSSMSVIAMGKLESLSTWDKMFIEEDTNL